MRNGLLSHLCLVTFCSFGALALSPFNANASQTIADYIESPSSVALVGEWLADCDRLGLFGTSSIYKFTDNTLEIYGTLYVESDCQTPLYTTHEIYNVVQIAKQNESVFHTDLSFQSIFQTAKSERGQAFLESRNHGAGLCGISKWDVGQERELTQAACADANVAAFFKAPGTIVLHNFKLTPVGLFVGKIDPQGQNRPDTFSDKPMQRIKP